MPSWKKSCVALEIWSSCVPFLLGRTCNLLYPGIYSSRGAYCRRKYSKAAVRGLVQMQGWQRSKSHPQLPKGCRKATGLCRSQTALPCADQDMLVAWGWGGQGQAGSGNVQLLQEREQLPDLQARCCPPCQHSAVNKGNNLFYIWTAARCGKLAGGARGRQQGVVLIGDPRVDTSGCWTQKVSVAKCEVDLSRALI